MMRYVMLISATMFLLPVPASGQDHAGHSEHAGARHRDIKALPDELVAALLAGDGAGYALAAELNGYPGPRHVLDLREALSLTGEQFDEITRIFEDMNRRARDLGARLVERERELDRLFREREATEARVAELVSSIGELDAELRFVHLEAHLQTTRLLSHEQIRRYDQARGYGHDHGGGPH